MKKFFAGAGLVFELEMRQRVRGVAWYVLLGVFFVILAIVSVVTFVIVAGFQSSSSDGSSGAGSEAYSLIIYFVLLLGTLVAPAMSGNAINGDRESGTLATTQVTLITPWQIVFGKFFAAWATALGFLVVSLPFLVFGAIAGGTAPLQALVSIVVLAVELGVIAAIGVGLSGLIVRPLFSVVVSYLTVAALSLGTLIVFALGGLAIQTHVTNYTYDDVNSKTQTCSGLSSYDNIMPRYDEVWGALVANPYVLLADAVPTYYNKDGEPTDLFGQIKLGERSLQQENLTQTPAAACKLELAEDTPGARDGNNDTSRAVIDSTTPGWAVGLLIQLILAGLALWGAYMKTRTPSGRISGGSRVA
jgi:ABC-2 type transport system permease protein